MDVSSRLLGAAGNKGCRFGCLYCFTREPSFERCPRLDMLRTRDLVDQSKQAEVIQPICDSELLLMDGWRDYLDELVATGKTISFATKAVIDDPDLSFLKSINDILTSNGSVLHIGVTIIRLDEWQDIEPRAPSPSERIQTLRRLWEAGIATTVLVRPMLPCVTADELDDLVCRTKRFCHGYLSGPLYLTDAIEKYLIAKGHSFTPQKRNAGWQEGNPEVRIVESIELEQHLGEQAMQAGRHIFANNIEAALHAKSLASRHWSETDKWSDEFRREDVATVYVINPETKEFLLMFHRKLGKWLAPGGHVEQGESPVQAALREAKEELGVALNILPVRGSNIRAGNDFRPGENTKDTNAFCVIEEFLQPIGAQDPHIHVDYIYVATVEEGQIVEKSDESEVTARDWFPLTQIESLSTFDNIPWLCRSILESI